MILENFFAPENKRRKVNTSFDKKPSIHHEFNYYISKKYIKGRKVIDIGCWSGQFEKLAAKDTKKIIGIDPGVDAIKYAKKNVKDAEFRVGNALNLPFGKNSFDTAIFIEVIEHLPKGTESTALGEIARVLKPKGYLILSTPNKHPLSILFDPAYFLINHKHYSKNNVQKMLTKAGFHTKKVYKTGGVVRLITTFIDTLVKHILNININYPNFVKKRIKSEYYNEGFASLHFIAQRKS